MNEHDKRKKGDPLTERQNNDTNKKPKQLHFITFDDVAYAAKINRANARATLIAQTDITNLEQNKGMLSLIKSVMTPDDYSALLTGLRRPKIDEFVIRQLEQYMNGVFNRLPVDTAGTITQQEIGRPFNIAPFLGQSIDGATSFTLEDLLSDVRIGMSTMTENIIRIVLGDWYADLLATAIRSGEAFHKLRSTNDAFVATIANNTNLAQEITRRIDAGKEISPIDLMQLRASQSELNKSMVLFGMPFTYNMCMEGRHARYTMDNYIQSENSIASLDDTFNEFLLAYVRIFDYVTPLPAHMVKLPIGTSQGILLRGTGDDMISKSYAKFLLSTYASRCESRADLNDLLDGCDKVFNEFGYESVSRHAMLGLRRMHLSGKKVEPIMTGNEPQGAIIPCSRQTQGRIRAIFPFSEALKFWVKSYAEPIKSNLFHADGCFSVTPSIIKEKMMNIYSLFQKSPLLIQRLVESNECVCAYDLSECDRTFHRQLNNWYTSFLKKIIKNGDAIVGEHHDDGDTIFINGVRGSRVHKGRLDVRLDEVHGASTLSGQADVTLKNNVIHFCLIISAIKESGHFDHVQPGDLIEKLIRKGEYKDDKSHIMLHLHGDDVMIWLGDDPAIYDSVTQIIASYGPGVGYESYLVFLKQVIGGGTYSSLPISSIFGSITKNRLGEYPQNYHVTALLSAIDYAKRVTSFKDILYKHGHSVVMAELDSIRRFIDVCYGQNLCSIEHRNEMLSIIDNITRAVDDRNEMLLDEQSRAVSILLSQLLIENSPKSVKIRKTLLTDTYKVMGRADDARALISVLSIDSEDELEQSEEDVDRFNDILDTFGTYSIDPASFKGQVNLDDTILSAIVGLSRNQLKELIINIQKNIITASGRYNIGEYLRQILQENYAE